ncbi:transposable element Tcb1 transposase [Trichonephila clavipes]|nr:transposable element Tcb1 transposase [Trichonephila clavipes]
MLLNAVRYISDILYSVVGPFLRSLENFIFQEDIARTYGARRILIFFDIQNFEVFHQLFHQQFRDVLRHGPIGPGPRASASMEALLRSGLRLNKIMISTTPAEDRYIVLSAKRNKPTTAQQVANQFLAASGKQISRKTVARRLRGGGLYARRPVVCVPLTRQHRTARLQWCREHHNWTEQDWACVLFSDESRFSLSSDCRRQLIWRESGTAYSPENIQEKDRYPTCSIIVWAGIMVNGRTRLHVVANDGQRYIDEVLLPHVRLFRGAVGDKFVFMDGNATCHRTLAVQDCLDSEGIQRLVWPQCVLQI